MMKNLIWDQHWDPFIHTQQEVGVKTSADLDNCDLEVQYRLEVISKNFIPEVILNWT